MERTIIIECRTCLGTGLTKKSDGAAVECRSCRGTGKTEFVYNEFQGKKEIEGVTRVFPFLEKYHDQYFYTDQDYDTGEGEILHFPKYGCSYEEWKKGVKPIPMEEMYCPAEFCLKDTTDIENGPCSRCKTGASIGGCNLYYDKAKCWEEWHKNND